jgi:hypothetical protein
MIIAQGEKLFLNFFPRWLHLACGLQFASLT